MRKTTILTVCLALGFTASANAQSSEFDALLEDVTFGAAEQMVTTQAPEAAVPSAPTPTPAAPAPAPVPLAPAPETMALPPAPQVTETPAPVVDQAIPAPVAAPMEPVPNQVNAGACGTGCGSCQTCGTGHGHKKNRIRDTPCVPYTVPRLPTSTFYQYWRTNACYTNVWDGYRNQCPRTLDLSIDEKKKGCSKCASGACMALPAGWEAANASCDSCDSRR
ncbi:MAG: hypothetical protein AAFU85_06325 [Planctomycetota bacterium]